MPVEEYLGTNYDPDAEYVDGELLERHVGEWRHSRLQHLLSVVFAPRERGRFLTFTEQRVQISPTRRDTGTRCVRGGIASSERIVLTRPPHLVSGDRLS